MAIRKDNKRDGVKSPSRQLEDLLVGELTVGGDVLDRGMFYRLTLGMSDEQLGKIRESVKDKAESYYRRIQEAELRLGPSNGGSPRVDLEREFRFIDKALHTWFRPWTRLAGRMDDALDNAMKDGFSILDEKLLGKVLEPFLGMPEYQKYLSKEMAGYVYNRCTEWKLDYTQLPDRLKSQDMEDKFRQDFPFCVADMEWDLLSLAYSMGSASVMDIEEKPGVSNGYIGGKTRFDSYLGLVCGPISSHGKLTGIGQIDYKDCTNAFALVDFNQKAVSFYELSPFLQRSVLESVWDSFRFADKKKKDEIASKANAKRQVDFIEQLEGKRTKVNPVADALAGKNTEMTKKRRQAKLSL